MAERCTCIEHSFLQIHFWDKCPDCHGTGVPKPKPGRIPEHYPDLPNGLWMALLSPDGFEVLPRQQAAWDGDRFATTFKMSNLVIVGSMAGFDEPQQGNKLFEKDFGGPVHIGPLLTMEVAWKIKL